MSLKLFILVAALTVMATQAIKPIPGGNLRFRGGISTGGKLCKKYNPPARFRLKNPNMAFFEANCKGEKDCEWSDGMCGAKPKPDPKPPPPPKPPTEEQCRLANAGPTATSAEAQQLCGAANCKYFVKASTKFRCCHHPDKDKISFCDTPPSTGGKKFPEPDPVVKDGGKCDDKCCSDAKKIDEDMEKSQLGGGKCKVGGDGKCKHTDDGKTACPSQMPVGTKCKPKPAC